MRSLSLATLVASLIAFSGVSSATDAFQQCDGTEASSCPSGYKCDQLGTDNWQCLPEAPILNDAEPINDQIIPGEHTQELRKRQSNTWVRGPSVGKNERWPVHVYQAQRPTLFNMFLVGLFEMMRASESNILSYYEISGIHGAPFKSWTEPQPSNPPQIGYCTHGSVLFPTWHRPYLSLIEQRIHAHAVATAARFTGPRAAEWRDAANRVRLPYWDWAASDLRGALPSILMTQIISVTYPGTNGVPYQARIYNPLYSYRFTSNRKNSDFRSSSMRAASETRRQPPSNMGSSNNAAFSTIMRNSYTSRRQNTYNLFAITTFNQFSNRAWNGGSPSNFVSVESVHDEVHVAAGGNFGHMSYVEYSAFDPVFWLHHCMIDRLTAMYQAARPGQVVQPQQMSPTFSRPSFNPNQFDTIDTPLNPFRRSNGAYFTSRHVSTAGSIWALNYAYPEVPARFEGQSAASLQTFVRGRISALYGPSSSSSKKRSLPGEETADSRTEWLCFIKFNTKEFNGNMQVLFFLDEYAADVETRKTQAIASSSAFTSAVMEMDKDVTSTVALTDLLVQRGIPLNLEEVVPYLKKNFRWSVIKDNEEVNPTQIPSLFIGVSSTQAKYVDGLPVFGEWKHSVDVTEKRAGGFTKADDPLVEGVIAKAIPVVGEIKDLPSAPQPSAYVSKPGTGDFIGDLINKAKEVGTDILDKVNVPKNDDSDDQD